MDASCIFGELYLDLNAANVDYLYHENYAHALRVSDHVFEVLL